MKTPIVDFVQKYAKSGAIRLHMPGHKGKGSLGVEQYDITEIDKADVLHSAKGIILESENNATALFNTAHTYYSTEGSTHCIKAMLAIACNGKCKRVLAARNVHKAFLYAAALLDISVDWLYPDEFSHICSCSVTPEGLSKRIESMSELPSAVYITSPNYFGNIEDIKGLSDVCHRYNVPLLVDNAHGAYLKFLENDAHPITLGADMCCDSAHKTLPVLTGGAYLHISQNAPEGFCQNARRFLSVFASTSPSYLILQSLDMCNATLDTDYKARLSLTVEQTVELKVTLSKLGWIMVGDEPIKLTVNCARSGYSGQQVADALRKEKIECEFYDREMLVMMFTPEIDSREYGKIADIFKALPKKSVADVPTPFYLTAGSVMSVRQAVFSEQETVSVESAVGRVCAAPTVTCPPAVPPVISGELITAEVVKILKHYGIEQIDVVK